MPFKLKLLNAVLLFMFCCLNLFATNLPRGVVQSFSGPGGRLYYHEQLKHWEAGVAEERFQVFEPDAPKPESAGFVLFLHDRTNSDPSYYLAWIRHLVMRGSIVLFPRFQGQSQHDKTWLFHTVRAVKEFQLAYLDREDISLDTSKFSIIGHGTGGMLAANVAATSRYFGLPDPQALFITMPQRGSTVAQNLSGIQQNIKMIILSGDKAPEPDRNLARNMFYQATGVPTENKIHLTVVSDYYGQPPIVASKKAVLAPERPLYERVVVDKRDNYLKTFSSRFLAAGARNEHIDAFNWFAHFRIFDALLKTAYNKHTELDVLSDNPELRLMGYWSDGRKIEELIPSKRP